MKRYGRALERSAAVYRRPVESVARGHVVTSARAIRYAMVDDRPRAEQDIQTLAPGLTPVRARRLFEADTIIVSPARKDVCGATC